MTIRICTECGNQLEYIAKPGREWRLTQSKTTEIPSDIKLLTCQKCDDYFTNDSESKMICTALLQKEELLKECTVTNEFVFFWRGIFSQWHSSFFQDDLHSYHNCEQYMMSAKASLFQDIEVEQKILAENDPKKIKELGRQIKNFNENIWNQHKISIVTKANYLKFSQNKELKEMLLATEDRILVEASPVDKIWGIGMAADNKDILDISGWNGENLLGKCLMTVREILS